MPKNNAVSSSSYPLWTPSSTTTSRSMDWFSWLSRTTLDPSLIYDYGLTFARNELQLEDASYFNHELLQSMGISVAKHRLEILKLATNHAPPHPRTRPTNKISGLIHKYLRKCVAKFVFNPQRSHSQSQSQSQSQSRANIPRESPLPHLLQPPPQIQPRLSARNWKGEEEEEEEEEEESSKKPIKVPMYRSKTIALSGPLDGRMMNHHEKMMIANGGNRAMKLSGPLDGRVHDRMALYTNRSPIKPIRPVLDAGRFAKGPRYSGPLDARVMAENKSPRLPILRHSDAARVGTESPLGLSPKIDFEFDDDDVDDHTLWPSLFQDLKPT